MEISERAWRWYIERLRKLNDKAFDLVRRRIIGSGIPQTSEEMNALIAYAFQVSTRYGEAAAEVAAQMYDQLAQMSGALVPAAVPAPAAEIHEVAKAIVGTCKTGNEEVVASSISRLVKLSAVDTTMQNALRDGAQWAWIPHGDTCAFCLALASQGWTDASRKAIQNGHARHIHANCDCTYAVRFDSNTEVEGYNNGKAYKDMYKKADLTHWNTPDGKPPAGHENAELETSKNRINAMRRQIYGKNSEEINSQKASAAEKRKERESSRAEEIDV